MAFEYLKSSIIIVSLVPIVFNIAIIRLVVDLVSIFLWFSIRVVSFSGISSKIIPQGRVLVIGNSLELPVGEEAIDHSENIIHKTDDGIGIDIAFE